MRFFHYTMWVAMTLIFISTGALIAGQNDMIKKKQYEIILLQMPLSVLCELRVTS